MKLYLIIIISDLPHTSGVLVTSAPPPPPPEFRVLGMGTRLAVTSP